MPDETTRTEPTPRPRAEDEQVDRTEGRLAREGEVKQAKPMAKNDPRRKENRPPAGVLPTGNLREPNIGGTTTAPTPVPPGPRT